MLSAGAKDSGSIAFVDGGKLQIDGASLPANAISGFLPGAVIDLASIRFQNGATATLSAGNVLRITEGGSTYSLHLNSAQNLSGYQFAAVTDGGSGTLVTIATAAANTVNPGQVRQVQPGQTSTGILVSGLDFFNEAYLQVLSGGTADGTRIIGNYAYQWVEGGGFASGTVVSSGGQEQVWSGASASATSVDSAGFQNVSAGGTAYRTVVHEGGEQNTYGTTYNTSVASAGLQRVYAGTAYNTLLNGGVQVNSGTAIDTTVSGDFGTLFVYGTASGATVGNGSYLYVFSGGTLTGNSLLGSGAYELIYSGGLDSDTFVSGGAQQILGSALSTVVENGGVQRFLSGGLAQSVEVFSGAITGGRRRHRRFHHFVGRHPGDFSGGVAIDTPVEDGGEQIVLAGGTALQLLPTRPAR